MSIKSKQQLADDKSFRTHSCGSDEKRLKHLACVKSRHQPRMCVEKAESDDCTEAAKSLFNVHQIDKPWSVSNGKQNNINTSSLHPSLESSFSGRSETASGNAAACEDSEITREEQTNPNDSEHGADDKSSRSESPIPDDRTPKPPLRKGKWTSEEEAYTSCIINEFTRGFLPIVAGTTLRSFLSEKLNCDPMRITKKFAGASCIGKQVFQPCERSCVNVTAMQKAQSKLSELEVAFKLKLEQQKPSRNKSNSSSVTQSNSNPRNEEKLLSSRWNNQFVLRPPNADMYVSTNDDDSMMHASKLTGSSSLCKGNSNTQSSAAHRPSHSANQRSRLIRSESLPGCDGPMLSKGRRSLSSSNMTTIPPPHMCATPPSSFQMPYKHHSFSSSKSHGTHQIRPNGHPFVFAATQPTFTAGTSSVRSSGALTSDSRCNSSSGEPSNSSQVTDEDRNAGGLLLDFFESVQRRASTVTDPVDSDESSNNSFSSSGSVGSSNSGYSSNVIGGNGGPAGFHKNKPLIIDGNYKMNPLHVHNVSQTTTGRKRSFSASTIASQGMLETLVPPMVSFGSPAMTPAHMSPAQMFSPMPVMPVSMAMRNQSMHGHQHKHLHAVWARNNNNNTTIAENAGFMSSISNVQGANDLYKRHEYHNPSSLAKKVKTNHKRFGGSLLSQ